MRASLSSQVGISVFFSIVVAVGLVAMLTYLKAQDSLARMVESRNAFVAGAVKTLNLNPKPTWLVEILLNGEVIRLDGALRMPPR